MTLGDLGGLYSRSSLRPGVKKKEACCLIGYQEPFLQLTSDPTD